MMDFVFLSLCACDELLTCPACTAPFSQWLLELGTSSSRPWSGQRKLDGGTNVRLNISVTVRSWFRLDGMLFLFQPTTVLIFPQPVAVLLSYVITILLATWRHPTILRTIPPTSTAFGWSLCPMGRLSKLTLKRSSTLSPQPGKLILGFVFYFLHLHIFFKY